MRPISHIISRSHPRFTGEAHQREYEVWLGSFPREDLRALQPIADLARTETAALKASNEHEPRDMATLMQRQHIKDAVALGKTRPMVREFNELVIRLNVARLHAVKSGVAEAMARAQEPLTDLGKALRNVLKQLAPST